MKLLIADAFPEEKVQELRGMGLEVACEQGLKEDALHERLGEWQPHVLIVRSTRVTGDMIRGCPGLDLVIRAGSGYNTIDVDTASEHSVYVANCPGKNAVAVAELAVGLMVSIDRRIPDNVAQLRQGVWNKKEFSQADGLQGKTVDIVGLGRIGKEVAARVRGFGMEVIAWSRSLTPERSLELGVGYCAAPGELAGRADVVSVHLALTPETRGLIGKDFFEAMKPGAYFINTSRSEVVDQAALLEAMDRRGIKAGLDVFDEEPAAKTGEFPAPIARHPGLYGTHHIGASTRQAQMAVAQEAVTIVREYLATGRVRNCVNLMERTPASHALSVHHRNRVGILAGVLDVIRDAGINVETMENIIFQGAEGACARILLDGSLGERELAAIEESSEDIFSVSQVTLNRRTP
ncbi:MAG: phosphoglycerate dehydrogenase [Spirochaetota bacterium]